jgi:hypothetical protein
MMKNKKGFEMSFAWIFAIIVGAAILFFAIYAATKVIETEKIVSDTEAGKQLGILLNPVEAGVEEGKSSLIVMPGETRLFNECVNSGNFGAQKISISTKTGNSWSSPSVPSTFYNKYIFSSGRVEGKEYRVFSKQVYFPYKTADIVILWSEKEKYCFVDAPESVSSEIEGLNLEVEKVALFEECSGESIGVCFSREGCDVDVNLNTKIVSKGGLEIQYEDEFGNALLYGAIFAEPDVYECQLKRIVKRAGELAVLYEEKSRVLEKSGCLNNLEGELKSFRALSDVKHSKNLGGLTSAAINIKEKNDALNCKIF